MNSIFREAMRLYGSIDPRDLPDAQFFMNEVTLRKLHVESSFKNPSTSLFEALPAHILGIPARMDDSLPDGAITLVVENEYDRALRHLRAEGTIVNVMQPTAFFNTVVEINPPTLKALLRHWRKKWLTR